MEIDLSLIGMKKGKQYETIITTKNSDGTYNAAPIGVLCSGKNKVLSRIFKGSHTLDNIIEQKEYTVNITHDPEIFEVSTLGNLPQDCFSDDNTLKCCDAYFRCKVLKLTKAIKQSDPIKKKGEGIVIKSEVTELVIKKDVRAFNRGFGYVIESLSNLTRFDIAGEAEKQEYLRQIKEANRIVRKIGYKKDIKAMNAIKKELKNRGYDL